MRNKLGLVILGIAVVSLSGCSYVPNAVNPVSWYRDLTGASKNDDLGAGENQKNLDEGSNEPYPNLANVPAAPDTQLSGVDREKLTDSLIADRQNAQYSADNLRAGEAVNSVPPPALPSAAKPDESNTTASAALGASSPPPATAPAPASNAAPTSAEKASASPPTAASAPPSTPPVSAASAPTAQASAPVNPPAAAKPPTAMSATAAQRLPPRGSEAPPAESSLQSPTIPNVPKGEAATPAPPPPHIPAPQITSAAPPAASGAPALHPPTQSASAPTNAPATAAPSHSAISYRVADVSFAPGSAYLAGGLRGTIADVVKLHQEQGGRIRIVGFGEATGKDAAVTGLTLALDRAQAVAVALSDGGVPTKDISVEAAPVPARGGADAPRAEIYLEQ